MGRGVDTVAATSIERLPAPTRRALFGPLTATDVVPAVVRRFRAAIGMGLLADGDRLPRESDLATQLGITIFSLRDALSRLRDQELLVTRAGKHGGSFVTAPPEGDELERTELLSITSSELRDLSEWREMLAAQSAASAALRASEANHARLEIYARHVGSALTGQAARRAHGRFYMELASASQSMRMTRAEFGVHEEVDWLFALALSTAELRSTSSAALQAIAEAVRNHDEQAARIAAEHSTSSLLSKLAAVRLELIAASHQDVHPELTRETLVKEVRDFAAALLASLKSLADQVAPDFSGETAEVELRKNVAVAILQRVADLPPKVDELSVLADVGVVAGHRFWTEAWTRTELGPRRDTRHVMDPSREDFYDYESHEFMAQPRRRLTPWATGPYVDYGGADDYIITVSVPITSERRFFGIAAVDFLVADLERQLAPWLAALNGTCLLLNAEGRVIVSNAAAYQAGDLITEPSAFRRTELNVFGWRLLTATSRRRRSGSG